MSTNFYWTTSSTGNYQECYWNTSEDTLLDVRGATKMHKTNLTLDLQSYSNLNYRTKSGELIKIFLKILTLVKINWVN